MEYYLKIIQYTLDIVCSFALAEKTFQDETVSAEYISQSDSEALISQIDEFSKLFDFQDVQVLSDGVLNGFNESEFLEAMRKDHPHAHLNVIGMIDLYEYKSEVHKVETEDQYILELHRITGNKTVPSPHGKPVVFIMHGILASSSDWVIAGPERGLGFFLADAGYDVWMGNARGNRYSRVHKCLSTKQKKFWKFSWHEIGIYDLPAMIDYVLNTTNNKDLSYIGHSQGSTSFLVMLSERPEYNDKIRVMFSLAPVAYCSNMYSPIMRYLSKFEKSIRVVLDRVGPWELLPNRGLYKLITSSVCKGSFQKICRNILFIVCGFNDEQFDISLMPAISAHLPAGSSIYQLFHYAQLIKTGHFRQFDEKILGSSNPPSYNFKNIKTPISLIYADNDWLSDAKDVKKLYSKLPNPIDMRAVPNKKFNHIDFLYGIDVKTLVYDDILKTMLDYQNISNAIVP
ncbi:lipase 3-like [Copidosoma floridanum]|uniref:lipase 3-like n=1 Tax=Copidosoma floridanum TaxID=29053 RepID=UPI000C6F579F|nr:lipase 3-like [Copidosoma floridanum]XP_023247923.1 lipase 3-like [Copidosoma floridanum]